MGFMNALDVDAQELVHAIDRTHNATIDWYCRQAGGVSQVTIDEFHRTELMNNLIAQGWVPPTLAEQANRRVRQVINGEAPSIMDALVNASQLLVRPSDAGAFLEEEPLAEWEIDLLNAAVAEEAVHA